LNTVLIVKEFIREHSGEYKKWQYRNIYQKMMYPTFNIIFDFLLASGKIAVDGEGKICCIWNPGLVKRYLADKALMVR